VELPSAIEQEKKCVNSSETRLKNTNKLSQVVNTSRLAGKLMNISVIQICTIKIINKIQIYIIIFVFLET
jgi:hypothetical protein